MTEPMPMTEDGRHVWRWFMFNPPMFVTDGQKDDQAVGLVPMAPPAKPPVPEVSRAVFPAAAMLHVKPWDYRP